jgi:hypothetical protein
MQLTNTGYQEFAIRPGNNDFRISRAKEVAPHFGMKYQDVEKIIQSISSLALADFITIIDNHCGDGRLKTRVKRYLERQYGDDMMIFREV